LLPSVPLTLNPSTFAHGPNEPTTISAALPTTHQNNACCRVIRSSIRRRRPCPVGGGYERRRTLRRAATGSGYGALAVPLPRPAPDELAEMHAGNVELQLAELFPAES
jgi:hypothetical protein